MLLTCLAAILLQVPQIELRTSRFSAQYGYIRSLAEGNERASTPSLEKAVEEMRGLESSFPNQIKTRTGAVIEAGNSGQARVNELYWRTLDALVFSSGSVEQLAGVG
jgi:hypothetical protein